MPHEVQRRCAQSIVSSSFSFCPLCDEDFNDFPGKGSDSAGRHLLSCVANCTVWSTWCVYQVIVALLITILKWEPKAYPLQPRQSMPDLPPNERVKRKWIRCLLSTIESGKVHSLVGSTRSSPRRKDTRSMIMIYSTRLHLRVHCWLGMGRMHFQ